MMNINKRLKTINNINDCLNISEKLVSRLTSTDVSKVCDTFDFTFLAFKYDKSSVKVISSESSFYGPSNNIYYDGLKFNISYKFQKTIHNFISLVICKL